MRKLFLLSFISLAVFTSSILHAQETGTQFGLGVSLNPFGIFNISELSSSTVLPVGLTNFYAPITFNKKFRLEPELGIYSLSDESSSGSYTSKSSTTITRVGVGLEMLNAYSETFNAYYGVRVGLLSNSYTSSYGSQESTTKETDFYIGAIAGGEHMLSTHFGIGAEIQLNYVSLGNPTSSPSTGSSNITRRLVTSNAILFFRWYY